MQAGGCQPAYRTVASCLPSATGSATVKPAILACLCMPLTLACASCLSDCQLRLLLSSSLGLGEQCPFFLYKRIFTALRLPGPSQERAGGGGQQQARCRRVPKGGRSGRPNRTRGRVQWGGGKEGPLNILPAGRGRRPRPAGASARGAGKAVDARRSCGLQQAPGTVSVLCWRQAWCGWWLSPRHSQRPLLVHQIDGNKLGATHGTLQVAAHQGGSSGVSGWMGCVKGGGPEA